jgi:hypothetical protein
LPMQNEHTRKNKTNTLILYAGTELLYGRRQGGHGP